MASGGRCVTTSGIAMMPVWCADSWDLQPTVSPLTHQTSLNYSVAGSLISSTNMYIGAVHKQREW